MKPLPPSPLVCQDHPSGSICLSGEDNLPVSSVPVVVSEHQLRGMFDIWGKKVFDNYCFFFFAVQVQF